jgi:hypothetical protein
LTPEVAYRKPEMEFLDIRAIHSPFYWRILKKNILYSGFKTPYKKSALQENGKIRAENQTKTRVKEDSSLCPETSTKNAVQGFHLWIRVSVIPCM